MNSTHKTQFPIKADFEYNKIGSWQLCNPYTIAFVYPKKGKPFIIKGGSINVKKELEKINTPALIYKTLFYHGKTRTITDVIGLDHGITGYITTRKVHNKQRHALIIFGSIETATFYFRRPPRCWIKQLNKYC